jgi:hypothetical protein
LVAGLTLLIGLAPSAAAQTSSVTWTVDHRIQVSGPLKVCTLTDAAYVVNIQKYGTGTDLGTTRTFEWGRAAAPLRVDVDGDKSVVQTSVLGTATIHHRFVRPGTYHVTVSSDFDAFSVGAASYPLAPYSFDVVAEECRYYLTTMSVWIIPSGFRPWMGATMNRVLLVPRDAEGTTYQEDGTLEGFAIPTLSIGCAVVFSPSTVDVTITGKAGFAGVQKIRTGLSLELVYDKGTIGTNGTSVTCPYVGGGTSDTFALEKLSLFFPAEGGAQIVPHVFHAIRLGDVTGRTAVILERVTP